MDHHKYSLYYAKESEYVTLDGQPYIGPFHKMSSGILMTGKQHSITSTVIVAVNGKTSTAPPLQSASPNTALNENETEYDLLPELVNSPPVIIKSMAEASTPQVKPSVAAGTLDGDYMYLFPDGATKVHAGVNLTLRIEAEQPKVFNVENGILEIKDPQEGLTYRWFVDGESIVSDDIDDSLRAARLVSGSTLTITNMIPRYAGVYTCVVSNDIGGTDGGSLNLEVYNSNVDSFFYTNLVNNPNGLGEDGTPSLDGWESLSGTMIAKEMSRKTIGNRDKRIVVDPMNQEFHWTKEMMFPRPYQLDGGVLQGNPLPRIKTYITRDKYQYGINGGTNLAQIYQDIDITDLREHVRGSIYGVSGVTALISFYIGNAIYNYEPARPYLTPDERASDRNYYNGSARLSLENFVKMGPGFVKEVTSIQIEEYSNETRVPSVGEGLKPITILDPWNARLGKYSNQIYYKGGEGKTTSDVPSEGGNVDKHLFVADELFPSQQDRFTYGQYAEFQRIVLDKLNPKTTKIRLIYTIKATGGLEFVLNELGIKRYNITDGIFELPDWYGSWQSGQLIRSANAPEEEDKPFLAIRDNYRSNLSWPDSVEQRVPKQSISRAFASGFNITLIPNGSAQNNRSSVNAIYSRNTRVDGLVPSAINPNATPFDPADTGVRDVTITFMMDVATNTLGIQMIGRAPTSPQTTAEQVFYGAGLLPFDAGSDQTLLNTPTITNISQVNVSSLITNRIGGFTVFNPIIAPRYSEPYPTSGFNYAELRNEPFYGGGQTINEDTVSRVGLVFTKTLYTIDNNDKILMYNNLKDSTNEPLTEQYDYWAIPNTPLMLQNYASAWNNNQKAYIATSVNLQPSTTQWKNYSRFIITIGVHNTNFDSNDIQSLHAIDSYYIDFDGFDAVIHKKPSDAVLSLPSFDEIEKATQEQLEILKGNITTDYGITTRQAAQDESVFASDVYTDIFDGNVQMTPIRTEVNQVAGNNDLVASIELPTALLTNPRFQGGLNIPLVPPANRRELPVVNVVDGTVNFTKNTPPNEVPSEIYEENLQRINEALQTQINTYYNNQNDPEKAFFDRFDYNLPYDDPNQTSIITVQNEDGPNTFIVRIAIPEDSVIMTLGRRRNALNRIYESLQATRELPNENYAVVFSESNIEPTQAQIYTSYESQIDSNYKVILYGVRPATGQPALTDRNAIVGTPLTGVVQDREYTIAEISVMNTGSLV